MNATQTSPKNSTTAPQSSLNEDQVMLMHLKGLFSSWHKMCLEETSEETGENLDCVSGPVGR